MSEIEKTFEGTARVGKAIRGFLSMSLKPEDFSSPVALQMAFSRIYEAMMKMMEGSAQETTYVAEVRFNDDMGNQIVVAVDLGPSLPPLSTDRVRARIKIELYEED